LDAEEEQEEVKQKWVFVFQISAGIPRKKKL
jgi:hypothetical protein